MDTINTSLDFTDVRDRAKMFKSMVEYATKSFGMSRTEAKKWAGVMFRESQKAVNADATGV